MATEVTLPELGESVTEGTITAWLVDVGDEVSEDQPLFELSSDKIDTEVPSPVAGTLLEIRAEVDQTVDVGEVVALIGAPDEAGGDDGGGDADDGGQATSESEQGGAQEAAEEPAEPDEAAASGTDDSGGGGTEVTLPELGESVTEGTITAWLVDVGDEVSEDQPLFELSSDKIDTEVPSPVAGTLTEIRAGVDETVEVGAVVAVIGGSAPSDDGGGDTATDESAGADAETAADTSGAAEGAQYRGGEEPGAAPDPAPATTQRSEGERTHDGVLMSPIVRRMVAEHDLDPSSLEGTGQGGRITREDVEEAVSQQESGAKAAPAEEPEAATEAKDKEREQPQKAPQAKRADTTKEERAAASSDRVRTEDLSRVRQRIAAKMMESLSSSAQLTTVQEADMTRIMNLRGRYKDGFKEREGVSLSPFVFLCRAALIALRSYPMANAKADWDEGVVTIPRYVNLGIAVDTEKGLLVPNVKSADDLRLGALARAIADVAGKARGQGRLEMSDIEGGTFTMTNTGSRGVLIDTPILNYPEVAILGTGAIQDRPVAVQTPDGPSIGIRSMVYLSMTYDHRLLDGADAARFVTEVKRVVEEHDWEQEIES